MKTCLLFLTCKDHQEADKIIHRLLSKKLVVCIKKMDTTSSFLWEDKIQRATEVLLIMDSIEELFDKIELEVKKLHSYKTFTLVSTPVTTTTKSVSQWMNKELA